MCELLPDEKNFYPLSYTVYHSRLLTGIVHFGYFKQSHEFMFKKNILVQLISFVNVYYLEYFAAGRCPFISTGTICHFQCFLFRAFLPSTTLLHFIHIHLHWFSSTCATLGFSYKLDNKLCEFFNKSCVRFRTTSELSS